MAEEHTPAIQTGSEKMPSALDVLMRAEGLSKTGEQRAEMTLEARDCKELPRHELAGKTVTRSGREVQVMHNGLYVAKGAYQGEWQAEVIAGHKGVHEPQEEKVFYEALKRLPADSKMIELGSWWSYYSMWFLQSVKGGFVICSEPDIENLATGKANMELNGFILEKDAKFVLAAAGSKDNKTISFKSEPDRKEEPVKIRTVDSLLKEFSIDKLSILHMDIQGAELDALEGAKNSIKKGEVRFVFISTHHYSISGDPLMHQKCLDFVHENNGTIVANHTIAQSSSGDGLIVASFDPEDKDFTVSVNHRDTEDSLFRQPERDVGVLWTEYDRLAKKIEDMDDEIERREELIISQREAIENASRHPLRFFTKILGRKLKRRN